jgi:steroid delta-isomerase-like uncharacterized protein
MNSAQQNKDVVLRFIEVVNTGLVDALADIVSPDCVETDGIARVNSGVAGMADHVTAVRQIYPDLYLTVERQVAEGEWVATQYTARGTHKREWLGMVPSGKALVFTGVNVDRIVNGRIVEHGGAANMLIPFLQAGSLQPTAP